MSSKEINILPRCPECGRLTVDNVQHCLEKSSEQWARSCQLMKCVGRKAGESRKCGRVYGPANYPGYKGG